MIAVRKALDFVFTQDELRWVDDILPKNPLAVPPKGGAKVQGHPSNVSLSKCNGSKSSLGNLRQRGPGTNAEKIPMNSSSPPNLEIVVPQV